MKTLLSLKKHQVIIITILVVFFAFSASSALAFSAPLLRISEPEIIKETKPMIEPGFIPIGKAPHVEFPTINIPKPIKIIPLDLSIDGLFNEKFSITETTNSPADCVTPTAGMEISVDTTLCSGEHIYSPSGSSQFIKITASNVTLDCAGATLSTTGNEVGGWPAIEIAGAGLQNITIENCNINEFVFPVMIHYSDYITLSNITYNHGSIQIFYSDNGEFSYLNKPIDSDGSNYAGGLNLVDSHYNNIHDNTIYHGFGISLRSNSSFNLVHDNSLGYLPSLDEYSNDYPASFYLGDGSNNNEFYDNEIIENSDDGLNGITIFGESDPADDNTINNKIYNNVISNNYTGILLSENASNNEVYGNTLSNSYFGLYLYDNASNNEVYGNTINGSIYNGLIIWSNGTNYPDNNTVTNNNFTNGDRDIVIGPGINNHLISNNTFVDTTDRAIWLWSNGLAANIPAENNQILNNKIIGSGPVGIELTSYSSINSNIEGNHINNRTDAGIKIGSGNTSSNIILNNFVNNSTQVTDNSSSTYDNGTSGNFWSDFDEPSEGCNDVNSDGVCDATYSAITGTGGNTDSYPLTGEPTLEPIENIFINELNLAIIRPYASDPQGDELTYSVDDPINFKSWESCWPGRNAFVWQTYMYSAGNYIVNLTVSDGVHDVSQAINVHVEDTCRKNKMGEMICTSWYNHVACY